MSKQYISERHFFSLLMNEISMCFIFLVWLFETWTIILASIITPNYYNIKTDIINTHKGNKISLTEEMAIF